MISLVFSFRNFSFSISFGLATREKVSTDDKPNHPEARRQGFSQGTPVSSLPPCVLTQPLKLKNVFITRDPLSGRE